MNISIGFSNFRILLLFCSILLGSCAKDIIDICSVEKPEFSPGSVEQNSHGRHFVEQNIYYSVLDNVEIDEYEWIWEPKESAKIEKVDKTTCLIIPSKSGELKVSVVGRKNNCYSDPVSVNFNVVENLNAIYCHESSPNTLIIDYMDLKYLFIRGKSYIFGININIAGGFNLINSEILNYKVSLAGPSYKNGFFQYTIDTKNKTLRTSWCTYYGEERCTYAYYKLKE
jgi:hypothetical protein